MKKLIALLISLIIVPSLAYADGTIDSLSAGSALGGTEQIPMFQSANPAVTTTPSAIKTYIAAQNLNLTGTIQFSGQTFSLGTLTNGDFCTWTSAGNVLNCNSAGGATGANPSATAGPSAINGSATTFMRSDAAPAVQKGSSSQFGIMECDGTTVTCPGGVLTASGGSATAITVGTTTVGSGTSPQFLYDNAGVLGVRTFNSSDLPPFTQQEVTTSCSVLTTSGGCSGSTNGDMGNGVVLGGSGATLTLSAKATGLWQPGQTFQISVDPAATGNGTLINSSTLTLRGINVGSTLYPGQSGTFVADSDGTHLDFVSGIQPATSTSLGGFFSKDCSSGSQFVQTLGTNGSVTCATPGGGTVTSITPGAGVSSSQTSSSATPITTTGTLYLDCSYLPAFMGGLTLSNDGTSPNTVIDVAAGSACDGTNAVAMKIAAFTKTLGAWTAGSGNGCLDTGTVANATWYALFLIKNTTSGTTDILCSITPSGPTMPSGYSYSRWIGSIITCDTAVCASASTNIAQFKQVGNVVYWATAPLDVNTSSLTTSAALETLHTPFGFKTEPLCRYTISNTGNSVILTSPDETDVAPTTAIPFTAAPGWSQIDETLTAGDMNSTCPILTTNTGTSATSGGQIRARASAASTTLAIVTRGYVM